MKTHQDQREFKQAEPDALLDIPSVAIKLRVSRPMVRQLILTGKLSALDVTPTGSRRTWRVPTTALTSYIGEQLRSSQKYLAKRRGEVE